jgi:hypothetical protein
MQRIGSRFGRDQDSAPEKIVLFPGKLAARGAALPKFRKTKSGAVAFEVVVTAVCGAVQKYFGTTVLPAGLAILMAFAAKAFGWFVYFEAKNQAIRSEIAVHSNSGNGIGLRPLRIGV